MLGFTIYGWQVGGWANSELELKNGMEEEQRESRGSFSWAFVDVK